MSGQDPRNHDETRKARALAFGRAVKGFRSAVCAAAFGLQWRRLSTESIRRFYPYQTGGMSDHEVEYVQRAVFEAIEDKGIQGLLNAFGGSLSAMEHVLRCGTGAVLGGFSGQALSGSTLRLAQDIVLDIYVFGTTKDGVPDFDSFMAYRTAKAFAYEQGDGPAQPSDAQGRGCAK